MSEPGPVAMKLLQGYLWHPKGVVLPELPLQLPAGAFVALDEIPPPFAFFDNGVPTASQVFYQLTVFERFEVEPANELLHERAVQASVELDVLLQNTPPTVGWSLSEDLRPV